MKGCGSRRQSVCHGLFWVRESEGFMSLAKRLAFNRGRTHASGDPLIGKIIDSKYELVLRLGAGGVGKVYLANRLHIGDQVAVKVLNPYHASNESYVRRFRREALVAAKSCSDRVVQIFDAGETADGIAYMVMQLIKAPTLREVLEYEGRLKQERAVALMVEICGGIAAVHQQGITHRDLKPENIMVIPAEEERGHETVKIVDFGYAKPRGVTEQPGMVVGTAFYMSPEQCLGGWLDVRSDVYSLGVILYQMLAGHPPFVGYSFEGIKAKHLSEPPRALPAYLDVDPALEAVLMRALAKDPGERYANAYELQCALRACTGPAPLLLRSHWQLMKASVMELCLNVLDVVVLNVRLAAALLNDRWSGGSTRCRGRRFPPLPHHDPFIEKTEQGVRP